MQQGSLDPRPAFLPEGLAESARTRAVEISGLALLLGAIFLTGSLASYAPSDPSFNSAGEAPVQNIMGALGAIAADLLIQLFGLASMLTVVILSCWGWRLVRRKGIAHLWLRLLAFAGAIFFAAMALAVIPEFESWPLRTGLGGVAGDGDAKAVIAGIAGQQYADAAVVVDDDVFSSLLSGENSRRRPRWIWIWI